MICLKCGEEIDNDATFCPYCGEEVSFSLSSKSSTMPATPYSVPSSPRSYPNQAASSSGARLNSYEAQSPFSPVSSSRPSTVRKAPSSKPRLLTNPFFVAALTFALVLGVFLILRLTGIVGGGGTGGEATAESNAACPIRSCLEDYSWDELAHISYEISSCADQPSAYGVAAKYNLLDPDKGLYENSYKEVTLADGTTTSVFIIDFYHDDLSSGSKAGITFMFTDIIAKDAIGASDNNKGGWQSCALRKKLQDSIMSKLPSDLANLIKSVDKSTNNAGTTTSKDAITQTSDKLWLVSCSELGQSVNFYLPLKDDNITDSKAKVYDDILSSEGTQYRYFAQANIKGEHVSYDLLKKHVAPSSTDRLDWWTRTPSPADPQKFYFVGTEGDLGTSYLPTSVKGIIPCFCI